MEVYNLILEVTRRCNMCCRHCLRGDAQNLDMSKEIIDKVLDSFDGFSMVTFTGGEPSLNIPIIQYFFEQAWIKRKMPSSFYLVTNGKENQEKLAMILLGVYPYMTEQEYCGIALSVDPWHEPVEKTAGYCSILRGLSFYRDDKENMNLVPIKEGRAESLNGSETVNVHGKESFYVQDGYIDDEFAIDELYVAANGKLIGNCDFSYEHIDSLSGYTVWEAKKLKQHLKPKMVS